MKKNFIIILNDNEMSIAKNVGGISTYLNGIRSHENYTHFKENFAAGLSRVPILGPSLVDRLKNTKNSIKQLFVRGMFFENMGITYLGPVDGHDIKALETVLQEAKRVDHAVLIHVVTKKGKGYVPAEQSPSHYHGVSPFHLSTGKDKAESTGLSYTKVFSQTMVEEGRKNRNIVAITAAMPDGTGLDAFEKSFPRRFFDVGIAEAHGVTSAAGMASMGLKPVMAVYSSFLQRGFDQLVHDVCLQKLPVVFAVDRAGLVGADGETHQGIFDLSYLRLMPNMTVMAPKNARELQEMLRFALAYSGPICLRYPRGIAYQGFSEQQEEILLGKAEVLKKGEGIALLALGSMVSTGAHIAEKMEKKGYNLTLVNARFAKPIDTEILDRLVEEGHHSIITLEENVRNGGFGEAVLEYMNACHPEIRVETVALPDAYVEHGSVSALREILGIDSDSIIRKMQEKRIFKD